MEAKDTVLDISYASRDDIVRDIDQILLSQAEITWRQAKAEVAREIINTLQAYTVERPNTGKVRIILDYGYWQSLKSKYKEGK